MGRSACCGLLLLCLFVLACVASALWPAADEGAAGGSRYKIAYATYLGGSAWDQAREVIPGPDGSALIGAQACSADMPTTPGAVQGQYAGDDPALGPGGVYGGDCYLARLSPDGGRLLAASYFGGSRQERNVYGMALDRQGNVVITSATRSPDAPTTPGCFQPRYGGGPSDWLVAKLSPDLKKVLWCTYVGGSGDEFPRGGLALDGEDNVVVVGNTNSANFPTTPGAFARDRRGAEDDAAIVKLQADGSGLVFSTLLGGSKADGLMGARVGASGELYVAGHTQSADFPVTAGAAQRKLGGVSDIFLAELSKNASQLLYATYLGGRENEFAEHRPFLGQDGTVLVTGVSASPDFPTTEGAFQRDLEGQNDGVLAKLSADGKRFLFSTLAGGSGTEFFLMPTPDESGNIVVVGTTTSADFPVTADALQKQFGGGGGEGGVAGGDGVLAILSPDGAELLYATYLGGSGDDLIRSVALGPKGEIYLVGNTSSENFPVTPGALQTKFGGGTGDAFVVKLVPR